MAEASVSEPPHPASSAVVARAETPTRGHGIPRSLLLLAVASAASVPPPTDDEFRALFEAVPVGEVVLDDHHRIRRANRAAAGLFGANPTQLVGRTLAELLGNSTTTAVEAAFGAVESAPGGTYSVELQARGADGQPFPLELTLLRLPAQAPGPRFGATLRDLRSGGAPARSANYTLAELLMADRMRELV